MQKTNKKLVKLLIFEIAAIAAIIYFTQTSWNTTRSTNGHLSKETYLNGGTGTYSETEYALTDDTDAYFSVSIQKKVNNLQRTIN